MLSQTQSQYSACMLTVVIRSRRPDTRSSKIYGYLTDTQWSGTKFNRYTIIRSRWPDTMSARVERYNYTIIRSEKVQIHHHQERKGTNTQSSGVDGQTPGTPKWTPRGEYQIIRSTLSWRFLWAHKSWLIKRDVVYALSDTVPVLCLHANCTPKPKTPSD